MKNYLIALLSFVAVIGVTWTVGAITINLTPGEFAEVFEQNMSLPFGSGGEEIDAIAISSSGTVNAPDVTYITDVTDDFAVGGTDSSAALFFDESAGDLGVIGKIQASTTLEVTNATRLYSILNVTGASRASSTLEATGAVIFYGDLNAQKSASTTDTTAITLAPHQSNHIQFISGTGGTITLPAVAEGLVIKVVVAKLFGTNAIVDSAEGDNIDGTLIVNDAPVGCAKVDQINFVGTADSLSDWVELTGATIEGTLAWIITSSNGDLAGSLTCTDPS